MGTPRHSVETIDRVLAATGPTDAIAMRFKISHGTVCQWRRGVFPVHYREAKAAIGQACPRGAAGRTSIKTKYSVAQIDAVLDHRGTHAQAAEVAGVTKETAAQWRAGQLPAFYLVAKDAPVVPSSLAIDRAARFVRPEDARAGR